MLSISAYKILKLLIPSPFSSSTSPSLFHIHLLYFFLSLFNCQCSLYFLRKEYYSFSLEVSFIHHQFGVVGRFVDWNNSILHQFISSISGIFIKSFTNTIRFKTIWIITYLLEEKLLGQFSQDYATSCLKRPIFISSGTSMLSGKHRYHYHHYHFSPCPLGFRVLILCLTTTATSEQRKNLQRICIHCIGIVCLVLRIDVLSLIFSLSYFHFPDFLPNKDSLGFHFRLQDFPICICHSATNFSGHPCFSLSLESSFGFSCFLLHVFLYFYFARHIKDTYLSSKDQQFNRNRFTKASIVTLLVLSA